MANTYTKVYIHFIFVVEHRKSVISSKWEGDLFKYIGGIVNNLNCKPLAVNGMPDHIHLFAGLHPEQSLSTFAQKVKASASKWVNESNLTLGKFSWQKGYAAFSYSHSQIDTVINYIKDQKKHHKKKTFRDEYLGLLKRFSVKYDEKYIFDFIEQEDT